MRQQKRNRNTQMIELVETHNIYLSLRRLHDAPGYDTDRWKRALYHALTMSGRVDCYMIVKLREALELP